MQRTTDVTTIIHRLVLEPDRLELQTQGHSPQLTLVFPSGSVTVRSSIDVSWTELNDSRAIDARVSQLLDEAAARRSGRQQLS